MSLKPWYKVVTPREDLREGRPLDASEFAVHLDHVRDGRAGLDYQDPERFLDRTFLTKNLAMLASQTLRRLTGETTETSAVFNMSTQFGGGKTHALTLLYHLARGGSQAREWPHVAGLVAMAGIKDVPSAATAIFVGTEFDSLRGRGGDDGTPLRKTPWGEIAFQLGGVEGFAQVAEHDQRQESPAGDVIRRLFPTHRPCLILMDELMNYVSRNRKTGLASQFYHFLHNLSETVRGERHVVLVVSIPASELEMTVEDQSEFSRLKKLLDRLGKAIVISAESESSEIIRRRLFEWNGQVYTGQQGHIILGNKDALQTCHEYADWVVEHRQQLPSLFPADQARDVFKACYPFHPLVLSVFERKWQSLPRFQQTRGVLRLLAQWVSHAYQAGFKGAHRDPLIGLGSAPLDDSLFRRAVFEQLGEDRLEAAITTDICGKKDSFAIRMDNEAAESIKKARLHRKVATTIFFESSGGQQNKEATLPEVRLATGEPDQDIGHVETVLEELASNCYYLTVEKNRYRFSLTPNLNKLLADRCASIQPTRIEERVRTQIQEVFGSQRGIERVFFPERSNQVPDRSVITLVVASPEQNIGHDETLSFMEQMIREAGHAGRTYKSALIWAIADSTTALFEEVRKWLAWEDIDKEDRSKLDDAQCRQLTENLSKAKRDTREAVWRSYKNIVLLGHNNTLRTIDLGLVHSSASESMVNLILSRLRQEDLIAERVNANFLLRNWPPALTEWSTRSVRDAFFASPKFPRLFAAEVIKDTIARGVTEGQLALVGKTGDGRYDPFLFEEDLDAHEVEFSDDLFILTATEAKKRKEPPKLKYLKISPEFSQVSCGKNLAFTVRGLDQHGQDFPVTHPAWQTTGGSVSEEGVFLAGQSEGEFTVTVDESGVSATARIAVYQEKVTDKDDNSNKKGSSASPKNLSWSGEIPHQKWMQFYNKVLSRFVLAGGLKITVSFDVASGDSYSPERLEEIRSAMRDLGLDDHIKK